LQCAKPLRPPTTRRSILTFMASEAIPRPQPSRHLLPVPTRKRQMPTQTPSPPPRLWRSRRVRPRRMEANGNSACAVDTSARPGHGPDRPAVGLRIGIFVSAIPLILTACATTHPRMPTPALYVGAQPKPLFAVAPARSESSTLDLLFVTDRAPAKDRDEDSPYTADRARFIAFGSTMVRFGDNLGWEELVKESTAT